MQIVLVLCTVLSFVSTLNCPNGDLVRKRGVSAEEKKIILDEHNKRRDQVAAGGVQVKDGQLPRASNMRKLVWDDYLASAAQAHTDYCRMEHFNPDPAIYSNNGQNLHQSMSFGPIKAVNWNGALKGWYDREVGRFTLNSRSPFKNVQGAEHFTQIVWADTTKIGCGYIQFRKSELWTFREYALYICHYSPPGNVYSPDGSVFIEMYTSGNPCSIGIRDTEYKNICVEKAEMSYYWDY